MDESLMKKLFNEEILKIKLAKSKNTQLFTRDEYNSFLKKVHTAKAKTANKTPEDYQRLSRYDIVKIGDEEKLIVPVKNVNETIKYFCYLEETFDIIHEIHLYMEHTGRNKMMKAIKATYKNITKEFVTLYLSLCKKCLQRNRSVARKAPVSKPIIRSEFSSLCQVDLIDMQSRADGDFKFLLIYQDYRTQFVILRPLKSKLAEEVANHLLDIFTIFGAPCILHSDEGKEFTCEIIYKLSQMWAELKMLHGNPGDIQYQIIQKSKQDVVNMVATWLETNKTTKWSEGLKFVQFTKNRDFHPVIKRSPYEAMFGCKARAGISTDLTENVLRETENEHGIESMAEDGNCSESYNIYDNLVSVKVEEVADDFYDESKDSHSDISADKDSNINDVSVKMEDVLNKDLEVIKETCGNNKADKDSNIYDLVRVKMEPAVQVNEESYDDNLETNDNVSVKMELDNRVIKERYGDNNDDNDSNINNYICVKPESDYE